MREGNTMSFEDQVVATLCVDELVQVLITRIKETNGLELTRAKHIWELSKLLGEEKQSRAIVRNR